MKSLCTMQSAVFPGLIMLSWLAITSITTGWRVELLCPSVSCSHQRRLEQIRGVMHGRYNPVHHRHRGDVCYVLAIIIKFNIKRRGDLFM